MKKITLILTSMLFLLVGGVFSQEVTTLYLDGGKNVSFSNQVYTDSHVTGAIVTFSTNTFNGKWNGLTGSNWVADLNAEETHTFTITLNSGAPAGFHFYIASNRYDDFSNGNARKYVNATIPEGATSVSYSIDATTYPDLLKPEGDKVGPYKWVYIVNEGTTNAQLNISSITRTISTPSSVAAPTISPASSTYDGDLSVTITKGDGNDRVVYSVSGATTGNVTNAEFTENSKTLNLTGTGTITVTATGYDGEDASSAVTNTYTYSIPSGIISVWSGTEAFSDNWGQNVEINKSNFANLEIGDYIYLNVSTPHDIVPNIGFRDNWEDDTYKTYTETSGGNAAYGNMIADEPYWWVKITDATLLNLFKTGTPRIQGQNFTLTSVEIHKAKSISENSDNTITKYTDMIVNLDRSFVAGTWNTVCLPFVPTADQANTLFGSGYKLAEFAGVSGTTMLFTTIDIAAFEAGKPYLVMPKTGCATGTTVLFDVDITAKTPTPVTWGDYTFTGTFTTKEFTSADNTTSRFVATENELVTPNENSTLKSLRCYFTVPVAAARSLSFDVDEEGNTTGVADINRETITNNGDFFNLAGQRVAQPTKGLYIVNGKKVVIK